MQGEPRAEFVTYPNWMVRKPGQIPWVEVEQHLTDARNYWVASVRTDGRPHARPVWGIWHDGALAISAGGGYWMLRNLRAHPQATAHLEPAEGMVIVVEGMARAITDKERLKRVAEVYGPKYDMVDTAGDFVTTDIVPDRVYAWITRAGSDEYQATRFVWD